jgi:hypothetical protein
MPKSKPKTNAKRMTPQDQHARFVEAAKTAEADESPDAMDKAFKRLAIKRTPRSRREDESA